MGQLLARSMWTYYLYKIAEHGISQKYMFKITENLKGHKGEIILPSRSSDDMLANTFGDFFMRRTTEMNSTTDSNNTPMNTTIVLVLDADVKFE